MKIYNISRVRDAVLIGGADSRALSQIWTSPVKQVTTCPFYFDIDP